MKGVKLFNRVLQCAMDHGAVVGTGPTMVGTGPTSPCHLISSRAGRKSEGSAEGSAEGNPLLIFE